MFNIIKIQQNKHIKEWVEVNKEDYEIKIVEILKNKSVLHLIYNNHVTYRLIYECNNCNREIETSWGKFVKQQIKKINVYVKNVVRVQKKSKIKFQR